MKKGNKHFKIVFTQVFTAALILFGMTVYGSAKNSVLHSITTAPQEEKAVDQSVKLNPPHGEPGHRCDIAVGAPLNSPANKKVEAANTTNVTPVVSAKNTTAKATTGRVGPTIENLKKLTTPQPISYTPAGTSQINPPHGQPGHRCDIPVGSPLPTTASNTTKINPPHGQPGHRCDIPVGSPLP
nr:hypothetical protein [uncultured Draconibacterium sp.]